VTEEAPRAGPALTAAQQDLLRRLTQGPQPAVTCVLGVDPGPVTGIAWLCSGPGQRPLVFQCNAAGAYPLASWLLEASEGPARIICAGERFITGRGAGARGANATATRQVISDLDRLARWHWRSAAEVKPWATDARLKAAGLLEQCHGMPHAADACRHALFAMIHDCGMPDPLSRKAGTLYARSLSLEELEGFS
jgi:hypothetical protein